MSWLSNTFKSLQFNQQTTQNDGVKDDLTAFGKSIGRQFRALLSPESSNSGENTGGVGGSHHTSSFDGIRSDFEEIKGTFKSSLSIFSNSISSNNNSSSSSINYNNAVNEISKLAVNFLNFNDGDDEIDVGYVNSMISKVNDGTNDGKNDGNDGGYDGNDGGDDGDGDDDDDDDDVGVVDDEVIEFAQQISKRAELWTEFPLSFDHEFDLSEAQYEHVSMIEQLVPSLADLRSKISGDKSEKQFWMIYFILLLPRLNEDDAELLSTPETVEARETLLKMIQSKKNEGTDSEDHQLDSSSDVDNKVHEASIISSQSVENVTTSENTNALGSAKSNEADQSVTKPRNNTQEEEKHVISESSVASASKRFQSEDDVSFSDLEYDDNDLSNRRLSSGPTQSTRTSSPEGSSDWVRLNKNVEDRGNQVKGQSSTNSEGEDSTGWLTVDDFDP